MAISFSREDNDGVLEVTVSGKLTEDDYRHFVPEFEQSVARNRKLRVLFEMTDFHGWTAGALWDDIKFDLKHHADVERLALVGEKKWQEWMATVCRPFTSAEIRNFDHSALGEARQWIRQP